MDLGIQNNKGNIIFYQLKSIDFKWFSKYFKKVQ